MDEEVNKKYNIVSQLTRKVFLIQRKEDGSLFILKKLPKCKEKVLSLLSSVNHPYILRYVEHFPKQEASETFLGNTEDNLDNSNEENPLASHSVSAVDEVAVADVDDNPSKLDTEAEFDVVLEYASGGDLRKMIQDRRRLLKEQLAEQKAKSDENAEDKNNFRNNDIISSIFFSEEEALLLFCPLVKALHYLHSNSVFHSAIRPENVFFCWDGTVKLGDFSLWGGDTAREKETNDVEEDPIQDQPDSDEIGKIVEDCSSHDEVKKVEKGEEVEKNLLAGELSPSENTITQPSTASAAGVRQEAILLSSSSPKTPNSPNGTDNILLGGGGHETTVHQSSSSHSNAPEKAENEGAKGASAEQEAAVAAENDDGENEAEEGGEEGTTTAASEHGAVATDPNDPKNIMGDVWGLGCLLYELLALEPPFTGETTLEYLNNLAQGAYKDVNTHRRQLIDAVRPSTARGGSQHTTPKRADEDAAYSSHHEQGEAEEDEDKEKKQTVMVSPPCGRGSEGEEEEYSQELVNLVADMLHWEPQARITEEEILALPLLQPYLRWLEEREELIERIQDALRSVAAEGESTLTDVLVREEEEEWAALMREHQHMMQFIQLRECYYLTLLVEREQALILADDEVGEEGMERWYIASEFLLEREVQKRYERQWRELLEREEALLCALDHLLFMSYEEKDRLWLEEVDYPLHVRFLRQSRATDLIVLHLTCARPHSFTLLPPIHPELEGERQQQQEWLRERVVEDNANILFRGPGMERPVLHEFMRRGDVEAVRVCLETTTAIDFAHPDGEGKTPLHWIMCGSKTTALLNTVLDRLDRRGPPRRRRRHRDIDTRVLASDVHSPAHAVTGEAVVVEGEANEERRHSKDIVTVLVVDDEVERDFLYDNVDWGALDHAGHDFISLAAYYGYLSQVWRILRERKVRYFKKLNGPMPIQKKVRLADWEQLCHRDREKKVLPVCGVET